MLKKDIGENAGIIWHRLFDNGALSVKQLGELTGYHEKMITLALGWLAREGKINFFENHETVYVELSPIFQELYY